MQRIILFLACLFVFANCNAQRYAFINYTPKDGLINNRTRFFFQDSRGRLYISTFGGLSLYDGSRFTNYTTENGLAASLINDIVEMGDDSLWIVPNTKQLQYMAHGIIKNYHTADNFVPVINKLIKCSDGFYYALADEGFYRFEKNRFKKIELTRVSDGKKVTNLLHASEVNGRLFMSSDPNMPIYSKNGVVVVYDLKSSSSLILENKGPVFFITAAPDSNILFTTLKGVFMLNSSSVEKGVLTFTSAESKYHIPPIIAGHIFFDRQRNLWLMGQNGVTEIQKDGTSRKFTSQNGLAENAQESLFEDRENIIWLAGTHSGICKIVNQDLEVFSELKNGFHPNVLYSDDNSDSVWMYDYVQNRILVHTANSDEIFSGAHDSAFNNIFYCNHSLYVSKWYEIYKVSLDRTKRRFTTSVFYKDSTASHGFFTILATKENNIIGVSDKVVALLKNGKIVSRELGYLADQAAIRKDSLWVVTRGNKLFHFKISSLSNDNYLSLVYQNNKLLNNGSPRSIALDKDDNLWIGTRDHGIFLFSTQHDTVQFLRQFTLKDGLSENFVSYLHCDDEGNIWACSPAGLDKIIFIHGAYYVENITRSANTFQQTFKVSDSKNGDHWVVTADGIMKVTRGSSPGNNYIPTLMFAQIKVEDSSILNTSAKPELNYLQNDIKFSVAVPTYYDEEQTRFSYLLHGSSEKNWSKPTNQAEINFVNLQPGNYTLTVKAAFLHGHYPVQYAEYSFIILPPWWQTWWFRIIVVSTIIGAIVFAVKIYYNRKIERERSKLERQQLVELERTRIATDMHDDLGAGLSRIKFLSETINIRNKQQKPIEDDIEKIKEYSDEMISKMGEIVWALNEKNDSLKDLLAYTRAYAAEYLLQHGIRIKIETPATIPDIFVSGEFRRNVFLTVKEALHNIIKHAHATDVKINIQVSGRLSILLYDNGIGFETGSVRPFSNGLMNMKKRIQDIGGEIEIKRDHGTTLKVSVPLSA